MKLKNMNRAPLWIGIFFLIIFTGCANDKNTAPVKNTNTEKTAASTENGNDLQTEKTLNDKNLLIIMEDLSGSTKEQKNLTQKEYKNILEHFKKKGCGQVAIRAIGNPKPDEQEFVLLSLENQYKLIPLNKKDLMSVQAKVLNQNKKILEKNKKINANNMSKIDQFLKNDLKIIVNYKPYKGRDVSNIDDALKHIETKLNEPLEYANIWVLIISDGIHDATNLKKALSLKTNKHINLYLVGWENKTVFSSIENVASFESARSFIEYYKSN